MTSQTPLWMLVLLGLLALGGQTLLLRARRRVLSQIAEAQPFSRVARRIVEWSFGLMSAGLWILAALGIMELVPEAQPTSHSFMEWGSNLILQLSYAVSKPLVQIGKTNISIFTLFQAIIFIVTIALLARTARRFLMKQILSKTPLDLGAQHAVATVTQYVVVVIGFMVALQTIGIDLSALTFLAGAVGVGIGFGLQNVTNNFISGIIILFERPIKIGDRIEVGQVTGDVVHIAARSTTVRTNDNIAIIIPNSSFIASNVINWSHGDSKVRFRVRVPVAYNSDVRQVEQLLLEVSKDNENVLEDPPPRVIFKEFGENALELELRVWSSRLLHRRGVLISQLNFAIFEKFKAHGIQIPYPQRDVRLRLESGSREDLNSPLAELRSS